MYFFGQISRWIEGDRDWGEVDGRPRRTGGGQEWRVPSASSPARLVSCGSHLGTVPSSPGRASRRRAGAGGATLGGLYRSWWLLPLCPASPSGTPAATLGGHSSCLRKGPWGLPLLALRGRGGAQKGDPPAPANARTHGGGGARRPAPELLRRVLPGPWAAWGRAREPRGHTARRGPLCDA